MVKEVHPNRIRVVLADKQITNHWLATQLGVTDMTVSRCAPIRISHPFPNLLKLQNY